MVVPDRRFTSDSASVAPRRLPEQPNLEQLRKQARELLRSYRSGKPSAVAEVDRFDLHADKDHFALNDAQRVIARAYGFASWAKLKAFVDGANIARFMEAAKSGDLAQVRSMLASRPELVGKDTSESNEHRAIHYAVQRRDVAMVLVLMEAGADARKGIFPHRDATTAMALAEERDYADVVAVIEEEERHRREEMSCLNVTVSPAQDQISSAIARGDSGKVVRLLEADLSLLHACDRDGRDAAASRRATKRRGTGGVAPSAAGWCSQEGSNGADAARSCRSRSRSAQRCSPDDFQRLQSCCWSVARSSRFAGRVALGDEARVRELIAAEPGLLRAISSDGGLVTLAVKHRQMGMVRLLLDLGADVNERIFLEELEEPTESWGMPLWHSALAGDFSMTKLLLDRGADPNANVYASGWPLRNAWEHEDESVKKLLIERGARVHPYMVAEMHDVEAARKILAENPDEEAVRELLWSAADHGCPEIVALALPHLGWALNDPALELDSHSADPRCGRGFAARMTATLKA